MAMVMISRYRRRLCHDIVILKILPIQALISMHTAIV